MVKRRRSGSLQLCGGKKDKARNFLECADVRVAEIQQLIEPIKVTYLDPSTLTAAPRVLRQRTERNKMQMEASLSEFGFIVPITVDNHNVVLAGHGRLAAALKLGLPKVPVVQVEHLTEEQKRAFRLTDNRLAELSNWDEDLLKLELAELSELDLNFNIEITGFDTVDLDRLLDAPSSAPVDLADAVPALAADAVTRHGEAWLLGGHRALCGDACDAESYRRLLQDKPAQMVFTDPPYNVPIQGHVSTRTVHREFPMAFGEMTSREFEAFLETSLGLMADVSQDGAIHFVCMDWRHIFELLVAAAPVYGAPKQLTVWAKDNAGMGTFYRSQHELVFIFKTGDAPHINNFGLGERGRYRTNVWHYPGAASGGMKKDPVTVAHPTVKPVAMVVDAIKDCSHRGGIILDPFGGSGTTLIAAERAGRRARLMELDPLYVDLIVRRWQEFTGKSAVHEATSRSFEEIAHARARQE